MLASAVIAAGALAACGRNDKTVGELIDPDAVFRDRRDRCLAVTADSLQPPRETISIEGESSQGAGATRAVVVDSIERYDVTYYREMGRTHQWFAVAGDSLLCGAQHEEVYDSTLSGHVIDSSTVGVVFISDTISRWLWKSRLPDSLQRDTLRVLARDLRVAALKLVRRFGDRTLEGGSKYARADGDESCDVTAPTEPFGTDPGTNPPILAVPGTRDTAGRYELAERADDCGYGRDIVRRELDGNEISFIGFPDDLRPVTTTFDVSPDGDRIAYVAFDGSGGAIGTVRTFPGYELVAQTRRVEVPAGDTTCGGAAWANASSWSVFICTNLSGPERWIRLSGRIGTPGVVEDTITPPPFAPRP